MRDQLKAILMKHEGLRLHPYRCTQGKLTIGVGRNLDDVGITRIEALALLDHDIEIAELSARVFPWYADLSDVRKIVVLDMLFNMGVMKFMGFKKFIAALASVDFKTASLEMKDSLWAEQVGIRADTLSRMMETNRI